MKKLVTKLSIFATSVLLGFSSLVAMAQNGVSATPFNQQYNSAQGVAVQGAGTQVAGEGGGVITAIKRVINFFLSILALVALCVLLWGGRQMVSAAGDEGQYKKGFTILKQAAFGLIFIGVAWLVVSGIFFLIGTITVGTA